MRWTARDHGGRRGLDFQVHAGDFCPAFRFAAARALAEFGEAYMPDLAQFEARRYEHTVDIQTCLAFEFEGQIHSSRVTCPTAEHPAATSKNSACEGLDEARRFFRTYGFHLQSPGKTAHLSCSPFCPDDPHARSIGCEIRSLTFVLESNGVWPLLKHENARSNRVVHPLVIGLQPVHLIHSLQAP